MNWTSAWKLAAALALAGSQTICAQRPLIYPNAGDSSTLSHQSRGNSSSASASVTHGAGSLPIIAIGSPLTFGGANSPDTYSATTTFSSTPVLVDNGALKIWQEQVPTGTNGEWDIFHMQTTNGGPLANNSGAEWNIVIGYTLTTAAVFDAAVHQWAVNGTPFSSLTNFGVCCAATSNPVLPGAAYYNSGFSDPLPAGTQTNWQEIFVRPYSLAQSGGVNVATANQFTFALHFTLQPGVPKVTSVISAGQFGAFPTFGPGSWIEIYGTDLGASTQTWDNSFTGIFAPTLLNGTVVTIGGQRAFIDYVSNSQVNAQVPGGVSTGAQPLVVTTAAGVSAPFTVTVDPVKPGLLAPASFKIGTTQYAVALFSDGVTYVLPPGSIPGITSRRAKAGDVITLYGIGFGSVNPNIPPGQIAQQTSTLAGLLTVSFGSAQAAIPYDGLAPNYVGLYQINVTVPAVAVSDSVPLTFTLAGANGTQQNLAIAVGN